MYQEISTRRGFLLAAAAGIADLTLGRMPAAVAASPAGHAAKPRTGKSLPRLPVQQAKSDLVDFGYYASGPEEGRSVILLHDLAYDIHSFTDASQLLAAKGYRTIVPYLRGHGTTRIRDAGAPRSGQQAAVGHDVIALMDALHIPEAVVAGFGWGARAATVAAILRPTRVVGLAVVNPYPVDDLNGIQSLLPARAQAALQQQYYYFQTERGRAVLLANRRETSRTLWKANSPAWRFDEAVFARAADAFDNPDFADVVIHSYRHRHGRVEGDPQYEATEKKLALRPLVSVPSILLSGGASGLASAVDTADRFRGPYSQQVIPESGHDLPRDAPQAFAEAVAELVSTGKWRT